MTSPIVWPFLFSICCLRQCLAHNIPKAPDQWTHDMKRGLRQCSLDQLFALRISRPGRSLGLLATLIDGESTFWRFSRGLALIYLAEDNHAGKAGVGVVRNGRVIDVNAYKEDLKNNGHRYGKNSTSGQYVCYPCRRLVLQHPENFHQSTFCVSWSVKFPGSGWKVEDLDKMCVITNWTTKL